MNNGKVRTGVPGLDRMLHGGLLPHRPYIVSGPPGAGKTVLSMQFLLEGVQGGERCLFVALEEPPNELKANMRAFKWPVDDIEVLDANSDIRRFEPTPVIEISTEVEPQRIREVEARIRKTPEFESHEVTVHSLQQLLKNLFIKRRYERVVIDSMTALRYFCMREFEETLTTQSFMRFLAEAKVTSLLTVELPEEGEVPPEAFLARGEIRLHKLRDETGIKRFISIEKYKGSSHDEFVYPFEITGTGVVVQSGDGGKAPAATEPRPPTPAQVSDRRMTSFK